MASDGARKIRNVTHEREKNSWIWKQPGIHEKGHFKIQKSKDTELRGQHDGIAL